MMVPRPKGKSEKREVKRLRYATLSILPNITSTNHINSLSQTSTNNPESLSRSHPAPTPTPTHRAPPAKNKSTSVTIAPAAPPVPQPKSKKRGKVVPETNTGPGPGPTPVSEIASDEERAIVSAHVPKRIAVQSHPPITIKLKNVSAPRRPSSEGEESEEFDSGVKSFKGKGKATESQHEQEGEDDDDDDEEGEGPSVKEEADSKLRYAPRKGGTENEEPCDACIKRNKACYTQDSVKARGACYECGRQRIKCIFSVRKLTF
jgi:hypothetical protein